jgi:hypothetical protein
MSCGPRPKPSPTSPRIWDCGPSSAPCTRIEVCFPEIFAEYERLDADCVLVSVMIDDSVRPVIAQAYAALHSYWIGYSTPAQYSRSAPAGIVAPGGRWIARCPANGQPAITVADLDPGSSAPDIDTALRHARPWRRAARAGLYDDHHAADDPRSDTRTSF